MNMSKYEELYFFSHDENILLIKMIIKIVVKRYNFQSVLPLKYTTFKKYEKNLIKRNNGRMKFILLLEELNPSPLTALDSISNFQYTKKKFSDFFFNLFLFSFELTSFSYKMKFALSK